jgi:hypothetical protein
MRKLKKLAKQAFDSMVGDGWYTDSTGGTFEKGYIAGYNEAIKYTVENSKKLEKTND